MCLTAIMLRDVRNRPPTLIITSSQAYGISRRLVITDDWQGSHIDSGVFCAN